ncbi:RNA polymerase II degradation factor 1-like [Coccinella septempunctata]|uniref:RNA polymerase II degradation factor 1-like n=1 Tax=Coccinella septempunctata TaxID=41139 RepID=UPI001D0902EE|nr:RNA polymerase II degradation factor 1-like [Coccinella septempunctata]
MISKLMILASALALSAGAYNGPLAGGQPASQFPAGIDPKACPNFPDCSSPLVAISQAASLPGVQHDPLQQYSHYQQPAQQSARQYAPQQYNAVPQQYNPAPQQQYNVPQYNHLPQQPQRVAQPAQPQYPPEIQNALDRGEYIGDGDYHGEGLAEAMAVGPINQASRQAYQPATRGYNPAPVQYQQPQAAPQYASLPPYREQRHSAQQLPAGVDGASCPNYPFCGQ